MGQAASARAPPAGNCELAGEWVPVRASEWTNKNIGTPHRMRAKMPQTKMTYSSSGKGKGWVGELYVTVVAKKVTSGQYSATAKVSVLFWSAKDGQLTLLPDGTLHVRYPSNGICEFWRRKGIQSSANPAARHESQAIVKTEVSAAAGAREIKSRPIMLLFRRVTFLGIAWHWALGVGDVGESLCIYEVGGAMAIIGPRGVIVGIPLPNRASISGTKMKQFHGYVKLSTRTSKTDEDIEEFSKAWCKEHPVYNALGPNCQTFAEDLHIYLTGEKLDFAKFGSFKSGPEASADAVWLNPSKKPKR